MSYQPIEGGSAALPFFSETQLEYHGGPVMPSNTDYAIYWTPAGAAAFPSDYESGLNKFFGDLALDSGGSKNVDSVASQYTDTAGESANYDSHFGGALIDEDPFPPNGCSKATICLTKGQLESEVANYVISHGLPHDLTHEYFLLTPPGVEDCFEASGTTCSAGTSEPVYCAYHGFIGLAGGPLVWSNNPYVTANPHCDDIFDHPNGSSDGVLTGGLSHEHNESITDPQLNAWFGPEGGENGDKCVTRSLAQYGEPLGTAPNGSRYNQVINGDLYWYQQEWSNLGSRCSQRLGAIPPLLSAAALPSVSYASAGVSGNVNPEGFEVTECAFEYGTTTAYGSSAPCASSPGAGFTSVGVTGTISGLTPSMTYHYRLVAANVGGRSERPDETFKTLPPPKPVVQRLSPKKGTAAGGTAVTISGVNLDTETTAVHFGAQLAASFTVNSVEHTVIAKSPPGTKGIAADVTVTTAWGTSPITKKDRFKYTK